MVYNISYGKNEKHDFLETISNIRKKLPNFKHAASFFLKYQQTDTETKGRGGSKHTVSKFSRRLIKRERKYILLIEATSDGIALIILPLSPKRRDVPCIRNMVRGLVPQECPFRE
ncbi:hypothetical protein CEXT_331711 [Caerostris extrusa]|uniref:Uncharacterized protein n=1 Tax=Caerostris extrusa TaxID=172846 RepID=A0AAV4THQ7_CAEEX|nr:hypothetical protein CEXT_331711 [Caerostris extrusa]